MTFTFAFLSCLYLDLQGVISILFSLTPPCILLREVIEWPGGHLASSQGQPTTVLKIG